MCIRNSCTSFLFCVYYIYHIVLKSIDMNINDVKTLRKMILASGNRIFKAKFIKKNSEVREMVCRLGVSKGLSGTGRTYELPEHLITVYDMQAHGYRNINVEQLLEYKCGKNVWNKGEKK